MHGEKKHYKSKAHAQDHRLCFIAAQQGDNSIQAARCKAHPQPQKEKSDKCEAIDVILKEKLSDSGGKQGNNRIHDGTGNAAYQDLSKNQAASMICRQQLIAYEAIAEIRPHKYTDQSTHEYAIHAHRQEYHPC